MKDGLNDIFLGGILINPIKVFGMTKEHVLSGYEKDVYLFCKEEFLITNDVNLSNVYTKLKTKYPNFKVIYLFKLIEAYTSYRDYKLRKHEDFYDYGNPYCPWPRSMELIGASFELIAERIRAYEWQLVTQWAIDAKLEEEEGIEPPSPSVELQRVDDF
jgi:hypothetical protein